MGDVVLPAVTVGGTVELLNVVSDGVSVALPCVVLLPTGVNGDTVALFSVISGENVVSVVSGGSVTFPVR